jgi:hypothetical protein
MPLAERAWLVPAPAAGVRLAPIDRLRGIVIILMALDHVRDFFNAERLGGFAGEVLETFGRVPLFIYILHLYVAHAAAVALWLAEGFEFHQLRGFGVHAAPPEGLGLGLAATYAAWILIMAALYPACRWYAGVKRRRRDWWLSYL